MKTDGAKNELTITELEKASGLNRRTIHFYVRERLIPPPTGTGGGARYGEEHLLRLLLIRQMQRSHLKLAGIRKTLDSMTLKAMRDLSSKFAAPAPVKDKEDLARWVESRAIRENFRERSSTFSRTPDPLLPDSTWHRSIDQQKWEVCSESVLYSPKAENLEKSSSWERIEIVEGFEIFLRSDLAGTYWQHIKELAARVRHSLKPGREK